MKRPTDCARGCRPRGASSRRARPLWFTSRSSWWRPSADSGTFDPSPRLCHPRPMTSIAQDAEVRVLRLSAILTILFTVGAGAVALVSDSETMTLEAMSGLVDVAVSPLALFLGRESQEPAEIRDHFGYAKS